MKRVILRVVALAAFIAAGVMVVPVSAHALVLRMELPELSRTADAVVVAKVTGAAVRDGAKRGARRPLPTTETRLQVTRVLAGERSQAVGIVQPGGALDGVRLTVSDLPTFSPGETCVLFLSEQDGVVGAFQGKLAVDKGRVPELGITVAELERRVRAYRSGIDPGSALDSPVASIDALGLVADVTGVSDVAGSGEQSEASVTALVAPSVASVLPAKQIAGLRRAVVIEGSGFGATQGSGRVQFVYGLWVDADYFDGAAGVAPVVSWSDTRIVALVPQYASSGQVRITTGGGLITHIPYDVGFSTSGRKMSGPVTYRINENQIGLTGEGAEIIKAFDTWNAAGSLFRLRHGGATTASGNETNGNGINEIWFGPLGNSGSLALNFFWSYSSGDHIESDIIFNTDSNWTASPSGSAFDVQSVALHELGHTVGLDDQYPNTDRVMGAAIAGETRRSLTLDEKVGAVFLHGQDPTKPAVQYPESSFESSPASSAPTATAFVLDRASRLAPVYGGRALVVVRLRDSDGADLSNRAVHLETATGEWIRQLSTGSGGQYIVAAPVVSSRTVFTVRFPGDAANAGSSLPVAVTPQAYLTRKVPTSARQRSSFTVSGTIKPAHTGAAVRVEVQKRSSSGAYRASSASKIVKTSSTAVKTSLRLSRGRYRVRLVHSDAGHARKATPWAYVRVR